MALTLNRSCAATIEIAAPIDVVWDLVSDITRVGEWSVECRSAGWLSGATGPAPGARFRGRNRRNAALWTRTCEVLAVDAPTRFVWRTLPSRLLPDSTQWTLELADGGDHTRLTESMHLVHIPGPYEHLFALMLPQHRDRTADLQADLSRIKQRVEAANRQGSGPATS
jgi:uncharacterized protein YndB with AHSA1/START domain